MYHHHLYLLYLFNIINESIESVPFESYQCGTSKTSRMTSWLLTTNCEQEAINICCVSHDSCYDSCSVSQSQCDQIFCNCLFSLPSTPLCRNLIQSLHCTTVQMLGDKYICPEKAEPMFPLKNGYTTLPPPVTPRITSTINDQSSYFPQQYNQYYQFNQYPINNQQQIGYNQFYGQIPLIRPAYIGYTRNRRLI